MVSLEAQRAALGDLAVDAMLDDVLARGTAIVQDHQGRVLQYAGDNILAVFGADEAREDDAERAVLCGLALLGLGQALEIEDPAQHDASAGLARVALAEQDAAGALAAVQPLLAHVDGGGSLEGTVDTRLIELSLHRVLSLNRPPRTHKAAARPCTAALSATFRCTPRQACNPGL